MNCRKAIAEKVVLKKAEYVLAMKGNHRLAHNEIKKFMDYFSERNEAGYETIEKAHGRIEARRYWQSTDIEWFEDKMNGKGSRVIAWWKQLAQSRTKLLYQDHIT